MPTNRPPRPKRFGVRYEWRKWFHRGKFCLTRGKHFKITLDGMRQLARDWASKLGVSVAAEIDRDRETVTVTVLGKLVRRK